MRTTVTLSDDVAAAVQRLRRERSIGVSEAVNELVRNGMPTGRDRRPFVQCTHDLGEARVDLTNIWKAIEEVEGPWAR